MDIITLDRAITDKERAELLFQGHLLIYRNIEAMAELIDFSDHLLRTLLDGLEPITAQNHLCKETFLQRTGLAQTKFRTCDQPKQFFFKALAQCGVNLDEVFYDHFPMRIVPFDSKHNGAHRAAIGHHRDTWGSNIQCQQNWWAPIYPLEAERTIAFYPDYWQKPIANTTDSWNFSDFLAQRNKTQIERQVNYPSAPQPSESVDETGVVKVVIEPGDVLNFSSAHLHASVANSTAATRFSVEMRTVHKDDLNKKREAPNVDNHAQEPMYQWFRSILSKSPLMSP